LLIILPSLIARVIAKSLEQNILKMR
jgi:hypothetical protein